MRKGGVPGSDDDNSQESVAATAGGKSTMSVAAGGKSTMSVAAGGKSNMTMAAGTKSAMTVADGGKSTMSVAPGGKSNMTMAAGGKSTFTVADGGKSTMSVAPGGKSNMTMAAGGKSTFTVADGGKSTFTVADGGKSTMTVADGGKSTMTVADGGKSNMTMAAGGKSTFTVADGGKSTMTVADGGKSTMTVADGGKSNMTMAAGGKSTFTVADGGKSTMSVAPGGKSNMTMAAGGKSAFTVADGGKSTMSVAPGGKSTMTVADGGKSNMTMAAGAKSTMTVADGGKSNMTMAAGGKSNMTMAPGGKSNMTMADGGKSNMTMAPGGKSNMTMAPGGKSNMTMADGGKSNMTMAPGGKSNMTMAPGGKSNMTMAPGGKSNMTMAAGGKSNMTMAPGGKSNMTMAAGGKSNMTMAPGGKSTLSMAPGRGKESAADKRKETEKFMGKRDKSKGAVAFKSQDSVYRSMESVVPETPAESADESRAPANSKSKQSIKPSKSKTSLASQKAQADYYKKEEEHARRSKKETERLEELLAYNQFPTIMGWFFDGGMPQHPFGLREEWAIYFNDVQEDVEAMKEFESEESFTELARRNFWPPEYIGPIFRTRGVYLDFKEVIKDPPRTPPEINFDREMLHIHVVQKKGSHDVSKKDSGINIEGGHKVKKEFEDDEKWYFDDNAGEFLPITDDVELYWDDEANCWRRITGIRKTPFDYYFNTAENEFRNRDRGRSDNYTYNPEEHVWRAKAQEKKKGNLKPFDFYFDEIECKWFKEENKDNQSILSKIPDDVEDDNDKKVIVHFPMGKRRVRKRGRPGSGKGPEEFAYNNTTFAVDERNPKKLDESEYDPYVGIWRSRRGEDEQYNLQYKGPNAGDYTWDDKNGFWIVRHQSEWDKPSPCDWYFDDKVGFFLPLDKMKREEYYFEPMSSVIKKTGVRGPPPNGYTPANFYWDETKGEWGQIEEEGKTKTGLFDHPSIPNRKILKGRRGKSGLAADEYYYCGYDGVFKPKEKSHLNDYYYDILDGAWLKMKEPGGPGKSGLYPDEYFFNLRTGKWEEKVGNIKLLRLKGSHGMTSPYDFYFDDKPGKFVKREPDDKFLLYEFDHDNVVWKKMGGTCHGKNGKSPKNFFFDEIEGEWFLIEGNPHKTEVEYHANGHRSVRVGQRGKTGKTPDDYYFDTGDDRYRLKADGMKYEYHVENGCWLFIGTEPKLAKLKVKPHDFFWDHYEGAFVNKKDKKEADLYFDKNANIWRKVRHVPADYQWDDASKKWVLISSIKKSKVKDDGQDEDTKSKKGKKSRKYKSWRDRPPMDQAGNLGIKWH